MQLLGPYVSNLQSFHYQELLDLYKQAIANGEFAGNVTFDEAAINSLISQSQDFATLPVALEGQRVTDDSLNTPLNLLTARFDALTSEANDFTTKVGNLITILQKDTALLDDLVTESALSSWIAQQPILSGSTGFSWDFAVGAGPTSSQITQADPLNGVVYSLPCQTGSFLNVPNATLFSGLAAPASNQVTGIKNMQWQWSPMTPGEQSEDLYGNGWAELNLLEDNPLVNFGSPITQVLRPIGSSIAGVFNVSGTVTNGALPIFVRLAFTPRRNTITLTPQNALLNPGFQSGSTGWTFQNPWVLASGVLSHSGGNYASKGTLPIWSNITTYSTGQQVFYAGQEWVSLTSGNLNNIPNTPASTSWALTGLLTSPSFPLFPSARVYIEAFVQSLAANGILNIALSCRDISDNEITPRVFMSNITSATNWIMVDQVVTALSDPRVVAGRLIVTASNQTAGQWLLDDLRVHLPQSLSPYIVNQDNVAVYTLQPTTPQPATTYIQNQDYVIDDSSNITFNGLADGTTFTVRFTENYPGYQCSVNEKDFSPLIMLDPTRPYPDNAATFNPIPIGIDGNGNRTLFPITDETGVPTGLTLQVLGRPQLEYYFQVTTPASPQYGATATLEIDLSTPTYVSGLTLTPFSPYPTRLTQVGVQPFTTSTIQTIGTPSLPLDRPITLTFPTTLIRKVFLTCYQESYELRQRVVQPPDQLRRDILFAIQTVLPFNIRRPSRAVPVQLSGAQYTFGLENLSGLQAFPALPGVLVSGPYRFNGCPEVFRFDTSVLESTSIPTTNYYLCWKAYNSSGVVIQQELTGKSITPGQCGVWPFPNLSTLTRSSVDHVDVFVKFVIRNASVIVQRFLLQIRGV